MSTKLSSSSGGLPNASESSFLLKSISFRDRFGNDLGGSPPSPVGIKLSDRPLDLLALRTDPAAEVAPLDRVTRVAIVSADGEERTVNTHGYSVILSASCMDTPLAILCWNKIMAARSDSKSDLGAVDLSDSISFHRTIRVPDDGVKHDLPPCLGRFYVVRGDNGDLLLPMYQAEAMWMSFETSPEMPSYALKVGVGDVCAITGKRWVPGELTSSPQNYMVVPDQPWLDGIVSAESGGENGASVRQFVAMPLDNASGIEKQLVDQGVLEKAHGGLRIEIYPTKEKYSCWIPHSRREMAGVDYFDMTPRTLGMSEGQRVVFIDHKLRNVQSHAVPELTLYDYGLTSTDELVLTCLQRGDAAVVIWRLTGTSFTVQVTPSQDTTWDLKLRIQEKEGLPPDQQRLIFDGLRLPDDHHLSEFDVRDGSELYLVLLLRGGGDPAFEHASSKMGLAAGGTIEQKIYTDLKPLSRFSSSLIHTFHVSIVNSVQFAAHTGRRMHRPTVTKDTYDLCGLPWFKLYDGDEEAVSAVSESLFNRVKTIGDAGIRGSLGFNSETCCICKDAESNATLTTCGHTLCSDCLYYMQKVASGPGGTMKGGSEGTDVSLNCPLCRKQIESEDIQYSSAPLKLADVGKDEDYTNSTML